MKPVYCAAVDLGATSGRVIVGRWENQRLRLTEIHRFPNQFRTLAGHAYWDLPYLWQETRAGLIKAKAQFPELVSVGVDSWAVDHVLVNEKGRPVFPVHAYRDNRTDERAKHFVKDGYKRIYSLTGIPSYPYNTSLQLQETLAACPYLADTATRCLFIADYFNFLLSGKMENELSMCSHAQLLDVQSKQWSGAAFEHFGIPARWFSEPAASPKKLGAVTGLAELKGVQTILVPSHDTAAAFTAMPAAEDGSDLYLSSGTWSLLGFESETPVVSDESRTARISNERMGDGRYRPLCSSLGLWLLEQTLLDFETTPKTARAWRELITAAAQAAAPVGLIDVTDATLFNPTSMRQAIDAQLKKNRQRPPTDLAGYVRLICDSLARGHADAVQTLSRLSHRTFKRILMVGGGSKNRLLCQATADASGLPVISFSLEGAVVGNLASQLIALKAVKNLADFRRSLAASLKQTHFQPRLPSCPPPPKSPPATR